MSLFVAKTYGVFFEKVAFVTSFAGSPSFDQIALSLFEALFFDQVALSHQLRWFVLVGSHRS